jgi:hypothetical protein
MKPYSPFIVIIIGGFIMKRIVLFFLLVSCAAALTFAQGNNRRDQNRFPPGPPPAQRGQDFKAETTSVSGNFTIAQGMIAVISNDITYLVRGLNRYIGFIDGLKEGAAVTLEGYAMPAPRNDKVRFLLAQKMTLNGKDYELMPSISAMPNRNVMPQRNQMPNQRNMMPPQRYPYPPPRPWGR